MEPLRKEGQSPFSAAMLEKGGLSLFFALGPGHA
jgi:hypothetical protein